MITSGLQSLTTQLPVGAKEARVQLLMKRWHEKAMKKKALLSTVSVLPLAACGGSDTSPFKADLTVQNAVSQFTSLQANGFSIKDSAENIVDEIGSNDDVLAAATPIELSSDDAITVAQSNALAC